MDEILTSVALLDGVRAGHPVSWRRLVDLYQPLVKRWCRQDGLRDSDIDDAWQDVFLILATRIGMFERRKPGAFRCWLRTISRRKVIDIYRARARLGVVTGGDPHDRFMHLQAVLSLDQERAEDAEAAGILYRRALELLQKDFAERTWRSFWGVVIEGRSPADVATDLGLTRNAVFQAKARVLHRLRQEFEGFIE